MPAKSTSFKKKEKMPNKSELECYTCGELGHFSVDCPNRADKKRKKARNVNVVTASNTDGYGNLPVELSVFQLHVGGLIWVLMFMCVLTSLCSLLIG